VLPSDLAPDGVSGWIDYHGGLDRLSRVGTFRATGDAVLRRKGASAALPPCVSIVPGSSMATNSSSASQPGDGTPSILTNTVMYP
jgi:hypothetical protein